MSQAARELLELGSIVDKSPARIRRRYKRAELELRIFWLVRLVIRSISNILYIYKLYIYIEVLEKYKY